MSNKELYNSMLSWLVNHYLETRCPATLSALEKFMEASELSGITGNNDEEKLEEITELPDYMF